MNRYALILFVLGTTTLANAQGFFGGMNLYMFNDQFANPALAGAREYGTSLTSNASYSIDYDEYPGWKAPLFRQAHSLDQSLFHGRGGFQLQWNQLEVSQRLRTTDASLAYSHGVNLGKRLILRAGVRFNFRSHKHSLNLFNLGSGDPIWPIGPNNVSFMDFGLSLHSEYLYGGISYHQLFLKEWDPIANNIEFIWGVFTSELGGKIPFASKSDKQWSWSLQPFVKYYYRGNGGSVIMGNFVNYGPLQIGAFLSGGLNVYPSIGLNTKYIRASYAYLAYQEHLLLYDELPKHEFALRLILPSRDKSRDFMGNKYRGF